MTTLNKNMIKDIKDIIKNNDSGFTIDCISLEKVNGGYSVSISNIITNETTFLKDLTTIYELLDNINTSRHVFKCIGGWSNQNNYYLDATLVVNNRVDAEMLAKVFNQKAYFDLYKTEEVFLK